MKNRKLVIRKGKKGTIYELIFNGNRKISTIHHSIKDHQKIKSLAEGEYDVDFVLEGGNITKLIIGGEEIEKTDTVRQAVPQKRRQTGYNTPPRHKTSAQTAPKANATAPYNFVPLNETVIFADEDFSPDFDEQKGNDGYIDLQITALSPLYIRQSLNEEQVKRWEELRRKGSENEKLEFGHSQDSFYRPAGGPYKIPGSSLRGMIRTLYEIVTYSKMTNIYDRRLYYRSLADKSKEFKDAYSIPMMSQTQPFYPKIKAGYLVRNRDNSYLIREAVSYHRVEEDLLIREGILSPAEIMAQDTGKKNKKGDTIYEMTKAYARKMKNKPFIRVKYKAHPESEHTHGDGRRLKYSKVYEVKSVDTDEDDGIGYLVLSGWMQRKRRGKHMHWIISEDTHTEHKLSAKQIEDYKDDVTRESLSLLDYQKNEKVNICPCFFLLEESEVRSFGHTGMFRLSYKNPITNSLPPAHNRKDLDYAEAVFGRVAEKQGKKNEEEDIALPGRVFVEDAVCTKCEESDSAKYPKILSGPKPNSFQLYLSQNENLIEKDDRGNITGLKNYDSKNSRLAGHKLYWHRKHEGWQETQENVEKNKKQYTKIKPLNPGSTFKGRIRFINLSDAELGALLFVLNLPEGHYHKIGMAKPLGLGSIKISAKLNLINREKRYSSLFDFGLTEDNESRFIKAYAELLEANNIPNEGDPWKIERLQELKAMLDYKKTELHPDETRYMEIERKNNNGEKNEYRDRPILKKPLQYGR